MDGSGFREGARPVGRLALPWALSHGLDWEKLAPSWHPGTVGSPWGELRACGGLQQTSRGARSPLPSCRRVPCGSVSRPRLAPCRLAASIPAHPVLGCPQLALAGCQGSCSCSCFHPAAGRMRPSGH